MSQKIKTDNVTRKRNFSIRINTDENKTEIIFNFILNKTRSEQMVELFKSSMSFMMEIIVKKFQIPSENAYL